MSKFKVKTVSRGKFTLTDAKGSPASRGKLETINTHTDENKGFVKTDNKKENQKHIFGWASAKLNIKSTPTKRTIQSLLCVFENALIPKRRNVDISESPTKRRRFGRLGS